ncbi:hypothetical protein TUN199_03775 [Pyrenophora tritici-repentis]|nr:hypothetical protein Alg130_04740 [Pyrenophora tritici-repentis]KAI0611106.1 hypothetical protein TUN205_04669 [Pyrenophora tritici-repentis]KAI0624252.1 hypothetical protein TUN199_03775 [Pyrenophora tritici-repentis]KAI1544905.1 hypothetical protein PtrSN001A_002509 [Pyrenophora tritici-repentis]
MPGLKNSQADITAISEHHRIATTTSSAELRIEIYHYTLGETTFYDVRYSDPILAANLKAYPVFLTTCSQIHTEARLIPFDHYEFYTPVVDLMVFCLRFTLIQREAIRFLCLSVPEGMLEFSASLWEERGYNFLTALFPNLRKVVLDDEHLHGDYEDCVYYFKDALEMERKEWEAFVRWVRKDRKETMEVEIRLLIES